MAAFGHKDVGWLDVAMDDALRVCGIECVGNLRGQFQQFFQVEGPSSDAVLERLPFEQLHGDEVPPALMPDLVNRADVGMVQRGGGARFTLETFQRLGIGGELFGQEFQSNMATEAEVLGFVHHAHAAATQLFKNAVMGDGLADHDVEPCVC